MKTVINFETYITASGKYPERLKNSELNNTLKTNTLELLNKINNLLNELNINEVEVSSGFRPSNINANLPNSAKKSLHMMCKACDIVDKNHLLYDKIVENKELLKKYSLWVEHKDSTPGWCHIDIGNRKDRELRVFKP